jgi:hypothetical protein
MGHRARTNALSERREVGRGEATHPGEPSRVGNAGPISIPSALLGAGVSSSGGSPRSTGLVPFASM